MDTRFLKNFAGMFSLVLWAGLPLLVLSSVTVPVTNHWPGGFQAKVCFTIDKEMTSWVVDLVFDHPVETLSVRHISRWIDRMERWMDG